MATYESELETMNTQFSRDSTDTILFAKSVDKSSSTNMGVRLDVRDVSYSVFYGGKEKKLLRNINMRLEPGEMCALMGSSGAGKR
jgi:ABC-type multidrug transport system ATPase subunit